jgi:hypothetical protein
MLGHTVSNSKNLFSATSKFACPRPLWLIAACFTCTLIAFTGCSTTPLGKSDQASTAGEVPNVELLGQMQLPPGSKIVNERTLILGAGDSWVGRITMEVGKDTNNAYSFFMDQFPRQGWVLVSAVRGANSLVVFNKQDRNATIEIRDGSLGMSATAVLTVTPKWSSSTQPSTR